MQMLLSCHNVHCSPQTPTFSSRPSPCPQAKENNFKAVLEAIRDLMNEDCVLPPWLHDILLGYGDPGAAQVWAGLRVLQPLPLRCMHHRTGPAGNMLQSATAWGRPTA